MKSICKVLLVLTYLFIWVNPVSASTFSYNPDPIDLNDLNHFRSYTWGIDLSNVPENETIVSATFSFSNIENWKEEENRIYLTLMDSAPLGVTEELDPIPFFSNAYADRGDLLYTWSNLGTEGSDQSYLFSDGQLELLNTYAQDDLIGFGIDTDCHFWNDGVTFEITTSPVPTPASFGLLGLGLLSLIGLSRRKRKY
jgi:hypothetical protein